MLLPLVGSRVRCRTRTDEVGVITRILTNGLTSTAQVRWPDGSVTDEMPQLLSSALGPGIQVLHFPERPDLDSYGVGIIEQVRSIAGAEQVLVDFWEGNVRCWLPWQRLKPVPGVRDLYRLRTKTKSGDAEAFRMRNLAWALDQWHRNTGALSRLEIDPLPHQIHLVHRILTSGNLNWLIADDVGLGKTIEVGLLMSALMRRGLKRFLFVVPAGLTRQWKEEMSDKFDIRDFRIYGDDFTIDDSSQWKMFDRVIASIDRLKLDNHKASIAMAERWDVVVFDEAHWLSRSESGLKMDSSDRYRLARELRENSDALLLLSGTPHQGRDDKFRGLLELLRPGPEWRNRFITVSRQPEILKDIIIRNRKADVTDQHGKFIFKGKSTQTIAVTMTDDEIAFDRELQRYLRAGYAARDRGGTGAILVGFVMTAYRKLAASSSAAISRALQRRLNRLRGIEPDDASQTLHMFDDARYVEADEYVADQEAARREFFAGEIRELETLIELARKTGSQDSKVEYLVNTLIPNLSENVPDQKMLIFTEYRTTQEMLQRRLVEAYGPESTAVLHGGQRMEERRAAIAAFEETGRFLISTEAGGEGLNLQRACHIMVNYDLPWNPMRLVQRVGRLYRYGQKKRVVVITLHAPETMDSRILQRMYDRLDTVALEMAAVSSEYQEGLQDDILGGLVGQLDAEDIRELLEAARDGQVERTEERMEAALQRARKALQRQEEILSGAASYDPEGLAGELKLDGRHLKEFARGMAARLGVEIVSTHYGGAVWDLRFPPELKKPAQVRLRVRIAFDRHAARKAKNVELFAPDNPVYEFFSIHAKSYRNVGQTAQIAQFEGRKALGTMLRWMDTVGRPLYQEYAGIFINTDGTTEINSSEWSEMLLRQLPDSPGQPGSAPNQTLAQFEEAVRSIQQKRKSAEVQPDSAWELGLAWCEGSNAGA